MKVELLKVEGASEPTYQVMLCEDDQGIAEGQPLGNVEQTGPGQWRFNPDAALTGDADPERIERLMIEADSEEELREKFKARFCTVEIKANRVGVGMMKGYADSALLALHQLALGTESSAGYLAALADAMAHAVACEYRADKREEVLDALIKRVRHRLVEEDKQGEVLGEVSEALRGLFTKIMAVRNGDDEPLKH